MKTFMLLIILLILTLGCVSNSTETGPVVCFTHDVSDLPLPTSGYDIYVIGETHGHTEIGQLFINYLEKLHQSTDCRHIILEKSSVFEEEINEYIQGYDRNWSQSWDSSYILSSLRTMNETLPQNNQFYVHCVDVDYTLNLVHTHLQHIRERISQEVNIEIPPLSKFETWDKEHMLALVDQLLDNAADIPLERELIQIQYSIQFACLYEETGGHWEKEINEASAIREEAMAKKVIYLLQENYSPLFGLFGAWHVQKCLGMKPISTLEEVPWTQRITESGIRIFSMFVGTIDEDKNKRDEDSTAISPDQFIFSDGTSLAAFLGKKIDYYIVYIDLRLEENRSASFGKSFSSNGIFDSRIPAEEIYDGILLFKN